MNRGEPSVADKVALFVAEGFGVGRLPFAPGTFGTLLGFVWIYLLLLPRSLPVYVAGIVLGFFLAVWIGAWGEKVAGKKDPGSIVIDEITALPLAFLPAVLVYSSTGSIPPPYFYFTGQLIAWPILTFILFRFFDIAKPLGIARVQSIPSGVGLVLDDFLAAIPAALILYAYIKIAG